MAIRSIGRGVMPESAQETLVAAAPAGVDEFQPAAVDEISVA
jgi:hypothetical protein